MSAVFCERAGTEASCLEFTADGPVRRGCCGAIFPMLLAGCVAATGTDAAGFSVAVVEVAETVLPNVALAEATVRVWLLAYLNAGMAVPSETDTPSSSPSMNCLLETE